jgi:UTP--glucose-1-phosphate uridylyltransferase
MSATPDDLRGELAALPAELRRELEAVGFRDEWLLSLAAPLAGADPSARVRLKERNRVTGEVRPPGPTDVVEPPEAEAPEGARLRAVGEEALRRGEVAFCVMAGGMATRMGGVVKALVEAFLGHTFLDLRLQENATLTRRAGKPVPLWLMTSDATDEPTRKALATRGAPAHVHTFRQGLGLRLTPEGRLLRDEHGRPSTYATGHGDLVDALRRSGLLRGFCEQGGRYVWIANLDNLGAGVDPLLLGLFIESGREVQVEVAPKANDKGGIPVWAGGRLQVLEEFRLPEGFDASRVRVFNTNTFLCRAAALDETPIEWHWFEVEKKVGGKVAIQFERLVQELTAALPAGYVKVPRDGAGSRFLPVKDFDELALRRPTIEAVARARGMIPG